MPWFGRPNKKPLWQDEFSVFTAYERYVSRRQLTKFLTLTSFSMFVGNAWILLRSWLYKSPSYTARPVGKADEVPVGGARMFSIRSLIARAFWCGQGLILSPPTARCARTFRVPSTIHPSATGWSARATTEPSRLRMDRSCRDHPSALCRAWSSNGKGRHSWLSAWNREGRFEPLTSQPSSEPGPESY
jgi:hypothetical protein